MSKLVTIAIPTYNRARYLGELLTSLIGQKGVDFSQIEIWVLDNLSPDHTGSVVEAAKGKCPFTIHYHRHAENIGGNRNIAYAAGCGEGQYVWVLGDDEIVPSGALARIVDFLRMGKDFVMLNHSVHDLSMAVVKIGSWNKLSANRQMSDRIEAMKFLGPSPSFISAIIAKRGILDSLSKKDADDYAQFGFNQLFAFYKGLPVNAKGLATKEILLNARGNNSGGSYNWVKFFVVGLSRVFSDLGPVVGYPQSAITHAKGQVVFRYHIHHLLNEKAEGRDCKRFCRLVGEHFGQCWQYRFVFRPLSFTPAFSWRLVKKLKKVLRK